MAPHHRSSEATDTRNGPDKDQSDSAEQGIAPHGGEETTPISTKTHHLSNHTPNGTRRPLIASHMASTIWHTVEFSRNRRASPRDLSISSERLCRSEAYLAFRPLPATLSGKRSAGLEPVPHPASGRTKRL